MMRQTCKQILTIALWLLLAATARAAGPGPIVTDPLTGVALDGYDAVSYFISPQPLPGSPDFEHVWGGVSWYFASAGNRDVFAGNPEVYAPQFGGHCLTALSRGYLSEGKPQIYAVEALKLYLFYSAANREAFLINRGATIARAGEAWPALAQEAGPGVTVAPSSETVPAH